jgi:hypothetical protein
LTLTVNVIVTECVNVPLVPVTVITNVPVVAVAEALNVIVDVPVPPETRFTLTGLNAAVVPLGGVDADNVTVPVNPFNEVRVIVEVPLVPRIIVTDVGDALMLKSGGAAIVTVNA